MIRDWSRWSPNWPIYNLSYHKGNWEIFIHSLNQILRRRISMLWWQEARGSKKTLRRMKVLLQKMQMTSSLKRTKQLRKLRFLLMGTWYQRRKGITDLEYTNITLHLSNRSIVYPRRVIEDVLVKVDKFIFLANFVIIDMEANEDVPIILGHPFLSTYD